VNDAADDSDHNMTSLIILLLLLERETPDESRT